MSPGLQAVSPDVSASVHSRVREVRVWGTTGVSKPQGFISTSVAIGAKPLFQWTLGRIASVGTLAYESSHRSKTLRPLVFNTDVCKGFYPEVSCDGGLGYYPRKCHKGIRARSIEIWQRESHR